MTALGIILILMLLSLGGGDPSGMYCAQHGRRNCGKCLAEWASEIEREAARKLLEGK